MTNEFKLPFTRYFYNESAGLHFLLTDDNKKVFESADGITWYQPEINDCCKELYTKRELESDIRKTLGALNNPSKPIIALVQRLAQTFGNDAQRAHDSAKQRDAAYDERDALTLSLGEACSELDATKRALIDVRGERNMAEASLTRVRDLLETQRAATAAALTGLTNVTKERDDARIQSCKHWGQYLKVCDENDAMKAELASACRERDEALVERDAWKDSETESQTDLKHVRAELASARAQRDEARGERDHLTKQLVSLQSINSANCSDLASVVTQRDASIRELNATRSELASARAQRAALSDDVQRLRLSAEHTQRNFDRTVRALKRANDNNDMLHKYIAGE